MTESEINFSEDESSEEWDSARNGSTDGDDDPDAAQSDGSAGAASDVNDVNNEDGASQSKRNLEPHLLLILRLRS